MKREKKWDKAQKLRALVVELNVSGNGSPCKEQENDD